ncbi:MAG: hypothetical protein ACFE68_08120 [Candidatus Hodarchaeota archaeon]
MAGRLLKEGRGETLSRARGRGCVLGRSLRPVRPLPMELEPLDRIRFNF